MRHVNRTELFGGIDDPRRRRLIEQVSRDEDRSPCTLFQRTLHDSLTGWLVAPDKHQFRPFRGKIQRDCAPDVGRRTRDDSDFSRQTGVHVLVRILGILKNPYC